MGCNTVMLSVDTDVWDKHTVSVYRQKALMTVKMSLLVVWVVTL
jgi:hypothetical protein